MNRTYLFLLTCWLAASTSAAAIPSQINYQGTLKQKGLPANGVFTMLFRLTNQDGTQVYWSGAAQPFTVTNGLFSTQISPSGVDWQNVTPYIEVSVEGQLLLPREPVAASVYANISQSVVDGAITMAKLDSGIQQDLVPTGAIMMFPGPCPAGWVRFSAMDNNFPMGSAAYGATGGTATHNHSINPDGTHTHTLGPPTTTELNDYLFDAPQGPGSHKVNMALADHVHGVTPVANHDHGGVTGVSSNLPPYLTVLFCQKQ